MLRRGIDAGELRADIDLEVVMAMLVGPMVAQSVMDWNPDLDRETLPERLVDAIGPRSPPASISRRRRQPVQLVVPRRRRGRRDQHELRDALGHVKVHKGLEPSAPCGIRSVAATSGRARARNCASAGSITVRA